MRFPFWSEKVSPACLRAAVLLLVFAMCAPASAKTRQSPARTRVEIGAPWPVPSIAAPFDSLRRGRQSITREDLLKIPVEPLGSTTIAPYPIPGDRAPGAVTRPRELNTPKSGTTMVAPMPPPMPTRMGAEPGRLEFRGGRGGDVKFQFDGREQADPDSGSDSTGWWIQAPKTGAVQLPRFLSGPAVGYPDAARRAGVQGTVVVSVRVRSDGIVSLAWVESGDPRLRQAALEMLERAKFEPGRIDGEPVPMWINVPVKFTVH